MDGVRGDVVLLSPREVELKRLTTIIYALYALGFFTGLTFIAALMMNYMKKADVAGTLFESHFRWQIRSFWFSLLWGMIGLATTVIGIGFLILLANTLWLVYRLAKGWMNLNENKPMVFGKTPVQA